MGVGGGNGWTWQETRPWKMYPELALWEEWE